MSPSMMLVPKDIPQKQSEVKLPDGVVCDTPKDTPARSESIIPGLDSKHTSRLWLTSGDEQRL